VATLFAGRYAEAGMDIRLTPHAATLLEAVRSRTHEPDEAIVEHALEALVGHERIEPTDAHHATVGDFARSTFFGMWRDRTDITDSVQFARDLRSEGWKRSA
jgi:hypothetical protein